jgi:transposase
MLASPVRIGPRSIVPTRAQPQRQLLTARAAESVTREQPIHHYVGHWRLDGLWERLNAALRERVRVAAGRAPRPSAPILDSQSVKTIGVGRVRGCDGAKKVSGRKRHALFDTLGLVLRVKVRAADLQNRAAVPLVLEGIGARFPRINGARHDQMRRVGRPAGARAASLSGRNSTVSLSRWCGPGSTTR